MEKTGKKIRFINSSYTTLFTISDGEYVVMKFPTETVAKPCKFLDEYHTQIGTNVFHICEFAEIMERNGTKYYAEPQITDEVAAWQVGKDTFLAIQTSDDGYDYTIFDKNYKETDGGHIDNSDISMLEVRTDILKSFNLQAKELRIMPVDIFF